MLLLSSADFFSKSFFSSNSFRNIIRVSNSLDPDQARQFVGPDLGPNCFQRLSADDTSTQRVKFLLLPFSLGDNLSYRNAERENKVMAMEAQTSTVSYPSRPTDYRDKENTLPQSKPDSRVLRETTALSNVTITSNFSDSGVEDSPSIQSLIEKMNSGLGVGGPIFLIVC